MEGGVIVFHRIKDIMSLKKYVLLATFQDGTVKTYDVSSLFEEVEAFNAFKRYTIFVRTGKSGCWWLWNLLE
ncbi:MAG: hypothetical protein ACLUKE_16645 [Blautia wexlerae]